MRLEQGQQERTSNRHDKAEILPRCERMCRYCTSNSTENYNAVY